MGLGNFRAGCSGQRTKVPSKVTYAQARAHSSKSANAPAWGKLQEQSLSIYEASNYTRGINVFIRTTLRRWGNSYGVVIPKDSALKEGIKENDEVEILVKKAVDIRTLFGKYKFEDVQKAKDELREGWR